MPTVGRAGSRAARLALAAVLAAACAHLGRERESRAIPPEHSASPLPAPIKPRGSEPAAAGLQWPVHGKIGSPFGARRGGRTHRGVDILAPPGTPVVAAAAGRVTFDGRMRGYGNTIVVEHGDGLETRYAHLRRSLVREGDRVEQGQTIGEVGTSGNATTPHLHFEVHEGRIATNPLPLLATPLAERSPRPDLP
jgi:murein DD-endopeptidase MepM/ murein hydrolase activator NlpD